MYVSQERLKHFWENLRDNYLVGFANSNNVQDYKTKNDASVNQIKQQLGQKAVCIDIPTWIPAETSSDKWTSSGTNSWKRTINVQNIKDKDVPFIDVRAWTPEQMSSFKKTAQLTTQQIQAFQLISYATTGDGTITFNILGSVVAPSIQIPIIIKIIR